MGFFDRLTNLGKGWVSTKTQRSDRTAAAELDALATERPLTTAAPAARTETAPPAAKPEAAPGPPEDEPAFDEPRGRTKKTL